MNDPEFAAVAALIALLADPAAAKVRLEQLQSAIDAAAAQKAEAEASQAALGAETARLAKLADDLRAREVKVHMAETKIADDLEKLREWKREKAGERLVAVGPSGLTKERDTTPTAPDPINDRYAESMRTPNTVVRKTAASRQGRALARSQ